MRLSSTSSSSSPSYGPSYILTLFISFLCYSHRYNPAGDWRIIQSEGWYPLLLRIDQFVLLAAWRVSMDSFNPHNKTCCIVSSEELSGDCADSQCFSHLPTPHIPTKNFNKTILRFCDLKIPLLYLDLKFAYGLFQVFQLFVCATISYETPLFCEVWLISNLQNSLRGDVCVSCSSWSLVFFCIHFPPLNHLENTWHGQLRAVHCCYCLFIAHILVGICCPSLEFKSMRLTRLLKKLKTTEWLWKRLGGSRKLFRKVRPDEFLAISELRMLNRLKSGQIKTNLICWGPGSYRARLFWTQVNDLSWKVSYCLTLTAVTHWKVLTLDHL